MVRSDPALTLQNSMAKTWINLSGFSNPIVSETLNDSLQHIDNCDCILVTGSLHLVGTLMSVLKVPIT
jgi:hypothetical protein